MMEEIYSRTQQLGEGRRLGKYERISGRVWRRMSTEVRRQEKLDMAEEKDFRRGELLVK